MFALLIAAVLGISLGSLAAYFRGRTLDRVARVIITALQSTPDFFLPASSSTRSSTSPG